MHFEQSGNDPQAFGSDDARQAPPARRELANYNAVRRALALCASVDEVKDIRDKAYAMELYAMQKNDRRLRRDMAKIRLRACVRLGEMATKLKTSKGGRPAKNLSGRPDEFSKARAVADAGIARSTAHDYEQLAGGGDAEDQKVADSVMEDYFRQVDAEDGMPSQSELMLRVREATGKSRKTRDRRAAEVEGHATATPLRKRGHSRGAEVVPPSLATSASNVEDCARRLIEAIQAADTLAGHEERLLDEVVTAIAARKWSSTEEAQ